MAGKIRGTAGLVLRLTWCELSMQSWLPDQVHLELNPMFKVASWAERGSCK